MTPDRMAALHAASFTTPRPWTEAEFLSLLASPGVFSLFSGSGFLIGRVVADEAEILTLSVDPARRRAGEGRALVRRFCADAAGRGAARGFLEVAADNAAAIALYKAEGWETSGLRRGYFRTPDGTPVDALVMTVALGAAGSAERLTGR